MAAKYCGRNIAIHITTPDLFNPAAGIWPYFLFDREFSAEKQIEVLDQQDDVLEHGKAVRCAWCKTVITYQGNAKQIQGQHVHSFVNPGGYTFTLGCFYRAWCKIKGLPTLEWSWFNEHTWQYALCPQCQEHLGWFYRCSTDDSSFYGLILDRLIIEPSARSLSENRKPTAEKLILARFSHNFR